MQLLWVTCRLFGQQMLELFYFSMFHNNACIHCRTSEQENQGIKSTEEKKKAYWWKLPEDHQIRYLQALVSTWSEMFAFCLCACFENYVFSVSSRVSLFGCFNSSYRLLVCSYLVCFVGRFGADAAVPLIQSNVLHINLTTELKSARCCGFGSILVELV